MDKSDSSKSNIQLRSALSLVGVDALASTYARSFAEDPWWRYLYAPNASTSPVSESKRALIEEASLQQCKATMRRFCLDPTHYTFLACDTTTDQIVGFAGWVAPTNAPHHYRHLTRWERLTSLCLRVYDRLASILVPYHLGFLLGFGLQAATIFMRGQKWAKFLEGADKRYIREAHQEQGFWRLAYCGVLPEYGRRGIGQQLLQWGLDVADEEDRAIYISASLHGLGAYKKVGFKEMGRDICYPADPQGGWPEIVCVRERKGDREK